MAQPLAEPAGRCCIYAEATSCVSGGALRFRLSTATGGPVTDFVEVDDAVGGTTMLKTEVSGHTWTLDIPTDWPGGLYKAVFTGAGEEVYFVVRSAHPGAVGKVLVTVPFLTWQAYNRAGEAGQSIYWNEQPDRAARVTFNRSGGGPAPEQWEHGMLRWLAGSGYPVEYCSGLDLHGGQDLLRHYQLLVVSGHDEYWTAEMRDTVEQFTRDGGNVAYFAANTCWWQVRLEDDLRTMVCYRDSSADPMAAEDPNRVTVEWSSAPVERPENTMTGVSFRRGAGNWTDYAAMAREAYTARFAEHWVFDGVGLRTGDAFAAGALGYETDAADFDEVDGVPLITGRDGTPSSFVVLATADLHHWRQNGQGGMATMGTFRLGRGTVFNAATINWGRVLDDPVVERITRNVLTRLSRPRDATQWDDIGPASSAVSLVGCGDLLFSTDGDGVLRYRAVAPQNLPWRTADSAAPEALRCLAAPREATGGQPIGLYGVSYDGTLLYRAADPAPVPWRVLGHCPGSARALAACDAGLFCAAGQALWFLRFDQLAEGPVGAGCWTRIDRAVDITSLAATNGRIFGITEDGRLLTRLPVMSAVGWHGAGAAEPCVALAAYAGRLLSVGVDDRLRHRDIPFATPTPLRQES
jgi:hypothetical protein